MAIRSVFDTHAHLDDARFSADLAEVIERARDAGVGEIISVGTDLATSRKAIEIAQAHEGIYTAVGFHPHDSAGIGDAEEAQIRQLAGRFGRRSGERAGGVVVALGEIGLDYFKNYQPRQVQRVAFERQAALAVEVDLPIILHNREATDDCLAVLDEYCGRVRGVAHCFSGDDADARRFLDLGFYVSFAGNVTYPKAENLRRAAGLGLDDRLLVETDCPYLAPQPVRGERNEPAFVLHTLAVLAEERGAPADRLAEITTQNARALFLS